MASVPIAPSAARQMSRRIVLSIALATAVMFAGVGLGLAVRRERDDRAQRAFFAMLADVRVAHSDATTVAGAREFAARYPGSRWVGEALRIVAMNAEDEHRYGDAEKLWLEFEHTFPDSSLPGVAYAELSRGLCDEKIGALHQAATRYRVAIAVIRSRHDGIQTWIATSAAQRLATLERREGLLAIADYWTTKAQTFADVYPIE